jgi:hypothetical protein
MAVAGVVVPSTPDAGHRGLPHAPAAAAHPPAAAPHAPAAAPAPTPTPSASATPLKPASTSVAVRYRVTLAARVCDGYDHIMGARVRGDREEALRSPTRDSAYQPGQLVAAEAEATAQPTCRALTGARFTFGEGRRRDGGLSTVTEVLGKSATTKASASLRDAAGKVTGGALAGAVTVTLSKAQIAAADSRGRLWVQGGTPTDPLPTVDGAVLGFGALRCALDHRDGANVAWLTFPARVRHVLCFAYYVRGAPPAGTVVVRAALTRPVGYPEPLRFASDLTLNRQGTFDLTASDGTPSAATFVRPATAAGAAPYTVTAQPPAGWTVPSVACAAARPGGGATASAAAAAGAALTVTLAAGETVTCTFTLTPPPPGRLTMRVVSEHGVGAFGLAVAGPAAGPVSPPGGFALIAGTTVERVPVTAGGVDLAGLPDGTYTITELLPTEDAGAWELASVTCDGTPVPVAGRTATVVLTAGTTKDCVFRNVRRAGSLRLRLVTAGTAGSAVFAVNADAPTLARSGGFGLAATTGEPSAPATASGDLPARLPLGTYEINAAPALSTPVGSWRLGSFDCGSGPGSPPSTADGPPTVSVTLTAAEPERVCTASYAFLAATAVELRWVSSEPVAMTLEISCADGAKGRVVAGSDARSATLPRPLYVTAPTTCEVTLGAGSAGQGVTASVESELRPDVQGDGVASGVGDGPLTLPLRLAVHPDAASYVVTVNRPEGPPAPPPPPAAGSFWVPPMVFVGAGIILAGAFLLLLAVVRRRSLLDQ